MIQKKHPVAKGGWRGACAVAQGERWSLIPASNDPETTGETQDATRLKIFRARIYVLPVMILSNGWSTSAVSVRDNLQRKEREQGKKKKKRRMASDKWTLPRPGSGEFASIYIIKKTS